MNEALRALEAVLFSAGRALSEAELSTMLPDEDSIVSRLAELNDSYAERGLSVVRAAGGWALRTRIESSDLATLIRDEPRRVTRAAMETMAVIAAFQPVTRSEIERVRGVQISPGVIDQLLAASWVRPGPRRETPGRPLTWTVTAEFYESFDITQLEDLVAFRRMKEANLLVLPPITAPAGLIGEEEA